MFYAVLTDDLGGLSHDSIETAFALRSIKHWDIHVIGTSGEYDTDTAPKGHELLREHSFQKVATHVWRALSEK